MKLTGGIHYSQSLALKTFVRQRDNYTCQLCGKEGWIVDHIIPYALSHSSYLSNLRTLCLSCNLKLRRKRKDSSLPIEEWEKQIRKELNESSHICSSID